MKTIFIVFLSIVSISLSGYQLDRASANKFLENLSGSAYIKKGIELGATFQNRKNFDDALYFYNKALKKVGGNTNAEAIVSYEIAFEIIQHSYNGNLSNLAAKLLTNASKVLTDKEYQYNIHELSKQYVKNSQTTNPSSFQKVIVNTQRAWSEVNKQKEQAAIEASTVRVDKDELSSIKSTISSLTEIKDMLSLQMQANETIVNQMSKDILVKEMLLEKQNRFIDSLAFKAVIDSLELENKNFEIIQAETQVNLQKAQNKFILAIGILIALLTLFLLYRFLLTKKHNKTLADKNKLIAEAHQRSEELLLNILPAKVAEELKINGKVDAQFYESATIMFTDFVNFSNLTRMQSTEQLVNDLDYCFGHFDSIVERYQLEKIKTIGDSYMCISGVPDKNSHSPENTVYVAIEFLDFIQKWNIQRSQNGKFPISIRIGIHTGEVAAGVVGKTKFVYDVWGDAVNTASRMESSSQPNRINVSESTFKLINPTFQCTPRGAVEMKNMKEMNMYFVDTKI